MDKKSGKERYPDFKLYKMIARSVHKHSADDVIKNSYFDRYVITEKKARKSIGIMNLDKLPRMTACQETPAPAGHP